MIFELLHAPFPEGYGEAILSLEDCRKHLRVDDEDENDLIAALRDASIDFIELYCSVKLAPVTGIEWRGGCFPAGQHATLPLSVSPVTAITAIGWLDRAGLAVVGAPSAFRVTPQGDVLPAVGSRWPSDIGGALSIVFDAGYAAGQAPPSLVTAVRLFLGHLYKNREAVTDRGTEGEVPFGVRQICAPFRRVTI